VAKTAEGITVQTTAPSALVFLQNIERYYSRKVALYGASPLGADWSCQPTQDLRFVQLLKLCDFSAPFSLIDLGCGYGALRAFLRKRYGRKSIEYLGLDISEGMIGHARQRWAGVAQTVFEVASAFPRTADYAVASGIFNVKLAHSRGEWEDHVAQVLGEMNRSSQRGFAVNFLNPRAEGSPDVPELYRPASGQWSEYCTQTWGSQVEVLSAYGMREHTLIVRKG
jgi:SAM-dependent methyltransferase